MLNSRSDELNTPLLNYQSTLLDILRQDISLVEEGDLNEFMKALGAIFGDKTKTFSNDLDFQSHVLEVLSKNSSQNDWAIQKKSKKLFIGSAFVISNATSILGYKVSPNDLDYFLKADPSIMTPAQLKMQKEIVILALCVMLIFLWFYVTKKSVLSAWLPQDAQSLDIKDLSLLKGVYAVLKNESQYNDAASIQTSLKKIIRKATVDAQRRKFEKPLQQCLTAVVLLLPLILIGVPLVPSGIMMFAGLSVLGAFMGGLVLAKSYSANSGSWVGRLLRGLIGLSSLIMPIASSMPLVIQMMGTNVSLMTAVINNPVVVIIPALSIIIGGLAAWAFLKGREAFNQSNVMQNASELSHSDQGDSEPEYRKNSVVICRALGKAFGTVNGICINSAICLGLGLGGVNGMLGLFGLPELQGLVSFALLGIFAVAGGYQSYRFTGDSIRSVWAQLGVWIAREHRTFDKVTVVSMGMSFLLGLALAVISSNAIIALPIFTVGGLLASSSGMVAGIVGVFTIIAVTSLFGDFFSRFLESSFKDKRLKQIAGSAAPGVFSWVLGCGAGLSVIYIPAISSLPVISSMSLGLGSPLIPSLGIGLAAIFLTKAVLSVALDRTGNFFKQLLNIWRAFLFTCASAGAVAFGLSSFVYFSQFNIILASAVLVVSTIVLGAFYCATSMQSDTVAVNQDRFNLLQETGQSEYVGGCNAERSRELEHAVRESTVKGLAASSSQLNSEIEGAEKDQEGRSQKAVGPSS